MVKTKKKKKTGLIVGGSILAGLAVVFMAVLPPSLGKVPQFKDAHGNVLPGSIAERVYHKIDGAEIGMYILGKDKTKPVLLVCGGGPGISQYLLEYMYPSVLPDKFVVCYFDYRGTGISYEKVDTQTITMDRYMADALAITEYLKERFGQEKIYIMGHSFGSAVALKMVDAYPENYKAYLAVSQACCQRESEYLAFDYMKEQYKAQGNTKMVKKMEQYHIRESEEDYKKYKHAGLRDKAMHELGVGTTRDMDSVITGILLPSLRCRTLTIPQRIKLWLGKMQSDDFAVGLSEFNAFEEIKSIQIPIYFFAGEYDYTCCESLQRKYYECIEAPEKEYYLYEDCAHSPVYEDSEKTSEILDEILRE